jgi:hypothetical protein
MNCLVSPSFIYATVAVGCTDATAPSPGTAVELSNSPVNSGSTDDGYLETPMGKPNYDYTAPKPIVHAIPNSSV